MKKFLHIVFGDSAEGLLKFSLKWHNKSEFCDEIFNFKDDFSIGPLMNIDNNENLTSRINWFEKIFITTGTSDIYKDFENNIVSFYDSLSLISEKDSIVIWHGKNPCDQTALRYLCNKFQNNKIYEIDISKFEIKFNGDENYIPKSVAHCNPQDIEELFFNISEIEKETRKNFSNQWNNINNSNKNLRLLENNNVVSVNENYFDSEILENCTDNFKMTTKIIGDTMGKSDHMISDLYIDYRIRTLINERQLIYRGNLKRMRDFEIKLGGKF